MSLETFGLDRIPRNTKPIHRAEKNPNFFEVATKRVKEQGDRKMKERADADDSKFHTLEHPESMQLKAEKLADILSLSIEEKKRISMAIAWHDVVIKTVPPPADKVLGTIQRLRGAKEGDQPSGANGNEALSAEAMEVAMTEQNVRAGKEIFSKDDIQKQYQSIEATYPAVNGGPNFSGFPFKEFPNFADIVAQNPEARGIFEELSRQGVEKGVLFFQPHLEKPLEEGKQIPLEVFVVATADLGTGGMEGGEAYVKEGAMEYQELHPNINTESLTRLLYGSRPEDEIDRSAVIADMLKWLQTQAPFAAFQYLRSLKLIGLLKKNGQINEKQAEELKLLTTGKSESSIFRAVGRAKESELKVKSLLEAGDSKGSVKYLAQQMFYDIPIVH